MFKTHKNLFFVILLIFLTLFVGRQLFSSGYFPMHDDLQTMRLYEMNRCFKDGQIPCRWSPDMGSGFGQPMFNYYSAFPYYLGEIVKLVGFSYVDTVKVLFLFCMLISSISALFLATQFFSIEAAFLAGAAYLLVPYRALDIFVRGAMSESFALALLPLVLGSIIYCSKKPTLRKVLLISISGFAFLTSHNITNLTSTPLIVFFSFGAVLFSNYKLKTLRYLFLAAILALGLSAFFLLPVFLERNLVNTDGLLSSYFDFRVHYVTLRQLFISNHWGYGSSGYGGFDDLSFSVGYIQILALIISPFMILRVKRKNDKSNLYFLSLFFVFSLGYIFLTHGKSNFIWTNVLFLAYVQFPWRMLGLASVGTAMLLGFALDSIPNKFKTLGLPVLTILLILLNLNFFKFRFVAPGVSDTTKLSGSDFNSQKMAAIADYLPKSSWAIPEELAPLGPDIVTGQATINYFDNRSNYFAAEFDSNDGPARVRFPVTYFENWRVYLNGSTKQVDIDHSGKFGEIIVDIPKGHTLIQGYFENTLIRQIANLITIVSFGVLVIVYLYLNYEKN